MNFKPTIWLFIFFLAIVGCNSHDTTGQTLKGYDLTKHEKFFMPESLREISGIAFHKHNSDTVYAIQDEEGKLYRLAWDKKKQYHTKFGRSGDYEDLTIMNEKVIILKSNGYLFTFPFEDTVYEELDSVKEQKHLLPKGEYESMFGDETTGKIYILCKNCPTDNLKEKVSGYVFQFGDSLYQTGTFELDAHEIKLYTGKVRTGFRPSALAKNSINNDWYILSSVNKLLVVTDTAWKVKEVCKLDAAIFHQPEGIAFDSQGNLYISNEGNSLTVGNILKFQRKKD